jgi:hypothetical protein
LLPAIEAPRLEQFLGADDTERIEELGADDVLAAFASVERQVGDACVVSACHSRDERRVLVVRMCGGVERAGRRLQPFEDLRQPGRAEAVNRPNLTVECVAGKK